MSGSDLIARLHIQLDDWQPIIWRRVEVPATATLKALHDVIQAVMPFEDYHLFEFRVDGSRYAIPDPEWDSLATPTYSAKGMKLGTPLDRGVTELAYTYDFGDDWRFTITVEAVAAADPSVEYPRFVDGEGRAPPEDVGGLPGFEHFLEVMSDPEHEEHGDLVSWHGGAFDPHDVRRDEVIRRVGKLAERRSLGRAGFAKSRNRVQ
ncbi:MAG TPA: plasmid pRiA4b ORF-3 family protein [Mesorhizobium sp.]|jgi:hypothetical protein|nr:plasmid pRiA4b ORF-3 family protein [Mesorhizobium sp.]